MSLEGALKKVLPKLWTFLKNYLNPEGKNLAIGINLKFIPCFYPLPMVHRDGNVS